MSLDPKDFASSFKGFMETMSSQNTGEEPFFAKIIREHFQQSPKGFAVVTEKYANYDHSNLFLAIEDYGAQQDRKKNIYGFQSEMAAFHAPTLAELVAASPSAAMMGRTAPQEGPVQYVTVPLADRSIACVQLGLYLISAPEHPLAILLRPSDYAGMGGSGSIFVDVMAADRSAAEKFLSDLRSSIRVKNVYKNHVLSIQAADSYRGSLEIKFHNLPRVNPEDIILPDGLLTRIQRNTIRFGEFSEALLAAKRHLKRGLLLYGPPGTGKTLTAMYLASAMPDRTILLLTGRSLELIQQSCSLARMLQPAMIVLEDVDLVAEERTRQQRSAAPLLFELLNEMDGLASDMDVIFLLTTNRADLLEPALASRPGRIDQAFEIPLPDAGCRRKLFQLYSEGLTTEIEDLEKIIARTEGASAAFMCELLRKSALFAAEDSLPIVVKDKNLDDALRELVVSGGPLTRSLLGFAPAKQDE